MKLKKAAQTTATRGLRTRVDTTVAMELAASWKPFMKSKARATRTMKGTIPSWFKKLDCFSFQSSRPPDQDFASFRIFDLPPRGRATGDLGPGVPPGRECCAGRAQPVRTASQRGSPGLPPDCVDLPAGASPPPPASCEDAYRLVRHRLTGSPQGQGQFLEVVPDGVKRLLLPQSEPVVCCHLPLQPLQAGPDPAGHPFSFPR